MTSYSRQAIILGLTLTLCVLILSLMGWLDPLEHESLDFRATYTWTKPRPMSDNICIAAIDDGALASIGRWPWPRATFAGAIQELRRAGAKVIALDLMLSDPQNTENPEIHPVEAQLRGLDKDCALQPDGTTRCFIEVNHDAILAAAMRSQAGMPGRCILGVAPPEHDEDPSPLWESPRGKQEKRQLLDVLKQDIQISADQAIAKAELRGERQQLFRNSELSFKAIAVGEKLQEMLRSQQRELAFEDFSAALTPQASEVLGDFPEKDIILRAWDKRLAWQHFRPLLPRTNLQPQRPLTPPIEILAASAAGVGLVDRQEDDDGEVRRTNPLEPTPAGLIAPFGVAAAAEYLGVRPADIEVVDNQFKVGQSALPLKDGQLWIAWPRMFDRRDEHQGIFRGSADDSAKHGIFSLGRYVSLAQQRDRQELNEREFVLLTGKFTAADPPPATLADLSPQMIEEARGYVDLNLRDGTSTQGLSEEERLNVMEMLRWREHDLKRVKWRAVVDEGQEELRKLVDGKLVFIGWTATGAAADFVPTPLDTTTPGVIVHAAVADMVLSGHSVRFIPPWQSLALTALIGISCTMAAAKLSPARSMVIVILVLGTYFVVAGYVAFGQFDTAIGMVAPMTAGGVAWVGCTALEAVLFQRDRLRITRQFKSRVSSQLVDYLVENPGALSVTGEQREMTVMFADLAGFTSLSETLGGPATVATINRYLGALTEPLIRKGGYVNKFLGDGYMAFWSAFAPDPEQATRAALAALEGLGIVDELNRTADIPGLTALRMRVGITTGRVVVGDCGAPPQLNDYTVIGDSVNLASRLESANKQFGTRILIDGRTRELLEPGLVLLRPIGRVTVFGQKKPVDIFEVLPPDASGEMIDLTAQAIDLFSSGELERSAEIWRKLIEQGHSRELALLYLEAIRTSGDQFDGVLHLLEK